MSGAIHGRTSFVSSNIVNA